jgi:hypothetical protein
MEAGKVSNDAKVEKLHGLCTRMSAEFKRAKEDHLQYRARVEQEAAQLRAQLELAAAPGSAPG